MDDLIAGLEAASEGSRELDALICLEAGHAGDNTHPQPTGWVAGGPGPRPVLAASYTSSLDAAMTLISGVPWLAPILDYTDTSARLVNGIGLPVGGTDHRTVAATMPLALCAAILKARARQEPQP